MSETVVSSVADKVATIRLNRPEKLNAFTDDMITTWVGLLEEYRVREDVNVIVITGTGRAFSTGGDVGKFSDYASNTAAAAANSGRGTASMPMRAVATRASSVVRPGSSERERR